MAHWFRHQPWNQEVGFQILGHGQPYQWLYCQTPGFRGSLLCLVGPVSIYCDWERMQVWSATSISVWHHANLSTQEQVTVFRLRTGHNHLNYHIYSKLHINHTEQRPCGTSSQTTGHLLQSCPLYQLLRKGIGAGIAQLVVLGLAVHSIVGSILLWGHFPVEGIFPLELTWVQTPFPQKLFRMRV